MNVFKNRAVAKLAVLAVCIAAAGGVRPSLAATEIADACVAGGSAVVSIAPGPVHAHTPKQVTGTGSYDYGSVREDVTSAKGTLVCNGAPQTLTSKVETYLLLPGGLGYATCFAILFTSVLYVLAATACTTVNQAQVGTLVAVPIGTSSTTTTCASATSCEATRAIGQQATTTNSNVALVWAIAYANSPYTLPYAGLFAATGAATLPGIYYTVGTFTSSAGTLSAKRYGQFVVTGASNPAVAIPGCDGTQADATGCLPVAAAISAPDPLACQANPAGGDPICPGDNVPEETCVADQCVAVPQPPQCVDNPVDGTHITCHR